MCRAVTEIELSLFPGMGRGPGAILSGSVEVAAAVQRLGCWAGVLGGAEDRWNRWCGSQLQGTAR